MADLTVLPSSPVRPLAQPLRCFANQVVTVLHFTGRLQWPNRGIGGDLGGEGPKTPRVETRGRGLLVFNAWKRFKKMVEKKNIYIYTYYPNTVVFSGVI